MERIPDPDRLREGLRESLKVALRARDTIAVSAIRSAMGAVDNAEAVDRSHACPPAAGTIAKAHLGVGTGEVVRRELSGQDVVEIIRAEISDRTAAAAQYESLGRAEQASMLKGEATVLKSFLETALREPFFVPPAGAGSEPGSTGSRALKSRRARLRSRLRRSGP
jgi:uncharacterized protein